MVRSATAAALSQLQEKHEADLAKALEAHEAELREAARQMQNEALLRERRYFRGLPVKAVWQTSEERVELVGPSFIHCLLACFLPSFLACLLPCLLA